MVQHVGGGRYLTKDCKEIVFTKKIDDFTVLSIFNVIIIKIYFIIDHDLIKKKLFGLSILTALTKMYFLK